MGLKGLNEKVVVVTGGASGIGFATASRLRQEGARVAILDVDADAAEAAAEKLGDEVVAITVDVSSESEVERAFAEVRDRVGKIDALHNNAGIEGFSAPIADSDLGQFDRLLAVNLRGSYLVLREMLRTAAAQGTPAAIVNTASGTALHAVPGMGQYAATKAAVISLTRNAAVETAASGVRVNAVVPGPIDTPLFERLPDAVQQEVEASLPVGRVGRAEEIAALACWLLSDETPFVTGSVYTADGGETA